MAHSLALIDVERPRTPLWVWVVFSVLLHWFWIRYVPPSSMFAPPTSPYRTEQKPMRVSLDETPMAERLLDDAAATAKVLPPAHQIVDVPKSPVQDSPDATLLAREAHRTEKETVVRQVGPARNEGRAATADAAQPLAGASDAATPAPDREASKLPDRMADLGTRAARTPIDAQTGHPRASQPKVSTWQDLSAGQIGSGESSAQPNYIDRSLGDVTLLNTRSSPFADYLIDRAHRTLTFLNINSELMTWYASDIRGLRLPAAVECAVGEDGQIRSIQIVESSGSAKVDRWLLQAFQSGISGRVLPQAMMEQAAASGAVVRAELHRDHIAIGIPD